MIPPSPPNQNAIDNIDRAFKALVLEFSIIGLKGTHPHEIAMPIRSLYRDVVAMLREMVKEAINDKLNLLESSGSTEVASDLRILLSAFLKLSAALRRRPSVLAR